MKTQKLFLILLVFTFCVLPFTFADAQDPEVKPPEVKQLAETEELADSGNVTLDFKDAEINSVLRIISHKSGVNIVATPEVRGVVTVRLQDVPWEKALDTIVRTYGFAYEWLGNKVIMVSTLERLAEQRAIQAEAAEKEPVDTEAFTLNFSRAADIKIVMDKLVSEKGKITVEARSNTLIITDTKSNLIKIGRIIKRLDKITPQVMIEAKIIEVTLGDTDRLGIDWTMKVTAKGSKRPSTFPFEPKGGSDWLKNTVPPSKPGCDFPTGYPYSFPYAVMDNFTFGALDFSEFKAVLEILNSRTDTNIISNPRITTLNNKEAKILVGKVVPIPTYKYSTEAGATIIDGYIKEEIGIRLLVTPNINEQNYITLEVKPSVDEIIDWTGPNNERPIISTRSADTTVMIKESETLVIGGLISETTIKIKKKVPILGDIPLLGLLFSKKEDTTSKTDLLIFITPHIIKEAKLSPEEAAKL